MIKFVNKLLNQCFTPSMVGFNPYINIIHLCVFSLVENISDEIYAVRSMTIVAGPRSSSNFA